MNVKNNVINVVVGRVDRFFDLTNNITYWTYYEVIEGVSYNFFIAERMIITVLNECKAKNKNGD